MRREMRGLKTDSEAISIDGDWLWREARGLIRPEVMSMYEEYEAEEKLLKETEKMQLLK